MKSEIQVILPSDLDQELRRYFYRVAKEAVDQVRIERRYKRETDRISVGRLAMQE